MTWFFFSLYLEKCILSFVCLSFWMISFLSKEHHPTLKEQNPTFKKQELMTSSENILTLIFTLIIVI